MSSITNNIAAATVRDTEGIKNVLDKEFFKLNDKYGANQRANRCGLHRSIIHTMDVRASARVEIRTTPKITRGISYSEPAARM